MAVGNSHGTDERDSEYPQEIQRLDLAMASRGIASIPSLREYARQIGLVRRIAKSGNIQMIHAARPLSEGLVARCVKFLTGIPYLCYVHGEDINAAKTSRELTLLTRSVLKHAQTIVANSNFTKKLLLEDWSLQPEHVTLMHPGVDTSYFVPAESVDGKSKNWIGKTVLLTVGRLQKRKGHDTVIQAIPSLLEAVPDLHYAIVGDGEERSRLERLAIENNVSDRVEFVGEINDSTLLECLQHCDIFVLANRNIDGDVEGFGIVLLEAQACGKPVIAGASGGTEDTMLVGQSGYIVDCATPDSLVEKLMELLSDPNRRKQMGCEGREHVTRLFDWEILGRKASKLFLPLSAK